MADIYRNIAEMMFFPGNRETWEKSILDTFHLESNDETAALIKYLARERDLINDEVDWSNDEKVRRLVIVLRSRLQ
jgi:hypothetical protein